MRRAKICSFDGLFATSTSLFYCGFMQVKLFCCPAATYRLFLQSINTFATVASLVVFPDGRLQ